MAIKHKRKKVKKLNELLSHLEKIKKKGKKIAYVVGVFDIVHEGHVEYLRFAKQNADIVVVGLNKDNSVKATKGGERPINEFRARAAVLSEFSSVDYIFEMEFDGSTKTPEGQAYEIELTKKLLPHFVVTGKKVDHGWEGKIKQALAAGAEMLFYEGPPIDFSTRTIDNLKKELSKL